MNRLFILALLILTLNSTKANALVRGADISWCTEMENDGVKFYNTNGRETDIFALMKEIGMSAIRLRVWVDPATIGYGAYSDKADVVEKAKRAHGNGLDIMVDFHYSDFFVDPGVQTTPALWKNMSLDELKTAVANHTADVLQALKDESRRATRPTTECYGLQAKLIGTRAGQNDMPITWRSTMPDTTLSKAYSVTQR